MLLMSLRFSSGAAMLSFLFILSLFLFRLFFLGLLFGRISAMLLSCALVLTLCFPLFHPFVLTRMGLL